MPGALAAVFEIAQNGATEEHGLRTLWLVLHFVGLGFWFLVVATIPISEWFALRSEELARARNALRRNYRLEIWGMIPALLLITVSGALLLFQRHEDMGNFFIVEFLVTVGVFVIVALVVIPATKEMWQATVKAEDFEDARETLVKQRLKELAFGFIPVVGTLYLALARQIGLA